MAWRMPAWRTVLLFFLSLSCLLIYNEFLIYYIVLLQCTWPQLDTDQADLKIPPSDEAILKTMYIADTHVFGQRGGHWFDRLRREWQMERAFQASMTIHSPELVFVLGDLLDEGKWASDAEFYDTVTRFHHMFRVPAESKMEVVVGNHDIGFHYMIDPNKRQRFKNAFDSPSVKMIHKKDVTFVALNSMAFEGDNCDMCSEAEALLRSAGQTLDCAQGSPKLQSCQQTEKFLYSRPIVLQHFPLFRQSDENCSGVDAASPDEKIIPMKPKWDCLSKDASHKIIELLNPRLVITAHTHHFCYTLHPHNIPEWTVPSFSWRNKKTPSFLLATVSSNNIGVSKCYMPQEMTVIYTYIVGVIIILLIFTFPRRFIYNSPSLKVH